VLQLAAPRLAHSKGQTRLVSPIALPDVDFDDQLDAEILAAVDIAEAASIGAGAADLPIYDLLRYHLGFVNAAFAPERADAGKRVRPRLCLLACQAAGGEPGVALHAAAAVELLHNFTLIHDDIQDESPLRRHRDTIWSRWGTAQAINAGDAMFAVAHLALNRSLLAGIDPGTVLSLSTELHQTTLRIVEGQVLDLGFEQRSDVTGDEYLRMVRGKTAAICRYAAWAGGTIAGAPDRQRIALAELGRALGIGFQLRDDLLGIWGTEDETGKAAADDIRRRKKSYPVVLLHERADGNDRRRLHAIYRASEIDAAGITEVLELLTGYEVQPDVQQQVTHWHDRAAGLLAETVGNPTARVPLQTLIDSLVRRSG
jgi:geranylgeranyl diphosphate synthase type I